MQGWISNRRTVLASFGVVAVLSLWLPHARAQPATPAAPPAEAADHQSAQPAHTGGSQARTSGPAAGKEGAQGDQVDQAAPASDAAATDDAAAAAVARRPADKRTSVSDEVRGTCANPRQAWLQLLYWLQAGERWEPKRAAACFDDAANLTPEEAGRRAVLLKKVLDRKPTWLDPDKIPDDPHYLNETGDPRYEDRAVARDYDGLELVKTGERWVFSAEALERVPALYPSLTNRIESMMPPWMKEPALGVEAWKYLAVILLIFVAFTLQKIVVFVIGAYGRRLVRHARFDWMKQAVAKADRPIGGMAMALVFHVGFPMLLFPPRVSQLAMVATQALAAYSAVWLGYRMIDVLTMVMAAKADATESKLDDQLVPLVSKTLKVFVSVVGFIFILQNLDVDVGSLLAGLGLGGLAFALAAKDTIANFFGSVMIFVDKPFQIGDWVVVSGVEGIVEEVGFRTSRVRTFYNSQVTVPNALVTNAVIDNYGRRQYRRYSTTLGITYDTPPDTVQAFCEGIRAIIAGMPQTRKDYYVVEFKEFGASSLNIMVYCFFEVANWNEEMRNRSLINLEIMRLAESLGVSFALPTQTVHIETLANLGEHRPSHHGTTDPAALTGIVDAFGPGGERARPGGARLSRGYENSPEWAALAAADRSGKRGS